MKNANFFLIILFGFTFLNESCKKNRDVEPTNQIITQTLLANQSYQFELGSFGDEEGASINIQATNFLSSTLERDNNTGRIVYKYVPATNFVGTDKVEIKSARGSDGASPCDKIINTTIKFTVTN
ncbi:MAG: hypothetical protein ABJA78_19350 [Ferruginibacter sp.]